MDIEDIITEIGKNVSKVFELQIGSLFNKYGGEDLNTLKLKVCGGCVLEIKKTNEWYVATFSNDNRSRYYPSTTPLSEVILEHCKCGKY